MSAQRIIAFADLTDAERTACVIAGVANHDPFQLRQLPNLRLIHSVWAGVERVIGDLQDPPLGLVPIVRLVDPRLAQTLAEAVLAWTLFTDRPFNRTSRSIAP